MSGLRVQVRRYAGIEVVGSQTARRALAVCVFALLTALSAYTSVRVPGSQVPISLQTLMVVLSGLLLGPRLGTAAQVLYVGVGAAGMPVFANGMFGLAYLLGPTGGFLLAFPAGAAVAGWIGGRGAPAGWLRTAVAATAGIAVVFLGGWAQLALLTGSAATAFQLGVVPFVPGDVLKVILAVLIASRVRRRTLERL